MGLLSGIPIIGPIADLFGGGGSKKDATKTPTNPTPPESLNVANALRDIQSAQGIQKQAFQDQQLASSNFLTIAAVGGAAILVVAVVLISSRK